MNISSLVVCARQRDRGAVCAALERMPGLEVHTAIGSGQMIVVADHDDAAAAADSFVAIHKIEGVLSVSLVYQFSDDARPTEEV